MTLRRTPPISLLIAAAAAGTYVSSLFLPAWSVHGLDSGRIVSGLDCLLSPLQEPTRLLNPVWWANVVFFIGLAALFRDRRGVASGCGAIGMLLAWICWLYGRNPGGIFRFPGLFDLGSYTPHVGFFLWAGAMTGLAVSVVPQILSSE